MRVPWPAAMMSAVSWGAVGRLQDPAQSGRLALQPVLLLVRDLPRLRPALGGRPARRRDAEHAHRLQAQSEALPAVGGPHVEAARQLAHALQAVADRVA